MRIKVVRHSFFDVEGGGNLRFTERSPAEDIHMGECNCTKNVHVRPSGTPASVQQEFITVDGDMSFRLSRLWMTFGEFGGDNHAYFHFHKDEPSVEIEAVPVPGYGLTECFFGHVYLGNQIDISKLMNGGWPSRIVDLSKIGPLDLWLHDCSMGREAMRFMSESDEACMWREALGLAAEIKSFADNKYIGDHDSSVEALRATIEADCALIGRVTALQRLLAPIAKDLKNTETFSIGDAIRAAIEPEMSDEERAWHRADHARIRAKFPRKAVKE
jgi:hypothetical protein